MRTYKKRKHKGSREPEVMLETVRAVRKHGESMRKFSNGQHRAPFFIFPRGPFREYFLNNAQQAGWEMRIYLGG
jgi:hypothetical protein